MRIAIDAGHGMNNRTAGVYDPGAVANGLKEHDVALGMASRLRYDLQALGHSVLLITDKPVAARDDAAKAFNADFLLSLHCNAGGGTGPECLVNTWASARSKAVARATTANLAAALGLTNRGVKYRDTLAVLRAGAHDALLEMFFLDSQKDVLAYQAKTDAAECAILNGLLTGLGLPAGYTTPPRISDYIEVRIHASKSDEPKYRALAASNNDFILVKPTAPDSFKAWK